MAESPPTAFAYYGAGALLELLSAFNSEIEGIRLNEDIECVHRMRVASRRMRAALSLYENCLEPQQAKVWRKRVRKITKSLGNARDLDVQIAFIEDFLADISEKKHRYGLERLLLRLRQARERAQPKVEKALDRLEASGLVGDMTGSLREEMVRARMTQMNTRKAEFFHRAGMAINLRLEELLSYDMFTRRPDRVAEHHEMRIVAKRLRYTIEFFAPLYGEDLMPFIKMVKRIQTYLGDMHDCDVWLERLPAFLEEEKARTREYLGHTRPMARIARGVRSLQKDRARTRAALFDEFSAYWRSMDAGNHWHALRECVQRRARQATSDEKVGRDQPPPPSTETVGTAPGQEPPETHRIRPANAVAQPQPQSEENPIEMEESR